VANVLTALRSYFLQSAAVSTLVGQRMYVNVMKQNATLPAIVYRRISTRPNHIIGDLTRLAHARIELTCYAATQETADLIYDVIRTSGIFSYRGTLGGIYFCGTELDSGAEHDDEAPTDGSQEHRYFVRFDLLVHYKEAT